MIMTLLLDYGVYFFAPLMFLALVVWTFRLDGKEAYRADGDIPFEEDDDEAGKRRSRR
jgi:cbb3-type cytochrome oxidase subunit 3